MLRFFVVALRIFATTKLLDSSFRFFILRKLIANTSQFSINQHKMNSLFFCRSSQPEAGGWRARRVWRPPPRRFLSCLLEEKLTPFRVLHVVCPL